MEGFFKSRAFWRETIFFWRRAASENFVKRSSKRSRLILASIFCVSVFWGSARSGRQAAENPLGKGIASNREARERSRMRMRFP